MWSIFKKKEQVLTGQDSLYVLTNVDFNNGEMTFSDKWDSTNTRTVIFSQENQGLVGSVATPYYEGTFHINSIDRNPQE